MQQIIVALNAEEVQFLLIAVRNVAEVNDDPNAASLLKAIEVAVHDARE